MQRNKHFQFPLGAALAGFLAGIVTGIFGGAGGMVLVPLLSLWTTVQPQELFPISVGVMLSVCLFSLWLISRTSPLPWPDALPYLLGSAAGGVLAGTVGKKVSTLWLHRSFGVLLLWGGVRYLW